MTRRKLNKILNTVCFIAFMFFAIATTIGIRSNQDSVHFILGYLNEQSEADLKKIKMDIEMLKSINKRLEDLEGRP